MLAALAFSMFLSIASFGIALANRIRLLRYLDETEEKLDDLIKTVNEAADVIKESLK